MTRPESEYDSHASHNNGPASQTERKDNRLNYSARKFLQFVHAPGSIIQVFVKEVDFLPNGNLIGFYDLDHLNELAEDVKQHSGQATAIFYSLNPVTPSCHNRAKNCLKPGSDTQPAKNSDILCRHLMLIDIDPVRDSGCSATDVDKEVAYWLGRIVSRDLRKAGWPRPVVVDSGNGYHLLYRVDLPVDEDGLIQHCLRALNDKYSCDLVKIDTQVSAGTQLAKLPGTMACKGLSSSERPHRLGGAFRCPSEFKAVPQSLLNELASQAPPKSEYHAAPNQVKIPVGNKSNQIANAHAYLEKMPPAISGQNGRNQFLNAACRLVDDFALTEEEARPLLEEYNQRCQPPFKAAEFDDKLSSALAKVAERGGPSGSAIKKQLVTPQRPTPVSTPQFIGFVRDFGYASALDVLSSVDKEYFRGYWIWYWLLWQTLRSDMHIPDVILRQLNWGAKHGRNWKAQLKSQVGLKPIKKANCSAETCMLYGTGVRHDHYCYRTDKYGLIDSFCSPEERQPGHLRIFDLYGPKYKELRETLQSQGILFNVYWPALVFGGSRKVGWTWPQQRLIVGMVRELTLGQRDPWQDIVGEIVKEGRVAAAKNTTHKSVCPLLDPKQEYVVFAGNGKWKGRGYQLVGRTGKGWIHRAGYLDAPRMNSEEQMKAVTSFLLNLEALSQDLDLIPAAVNKGEWKNLDEMIDCTRTGPGKDWLEGCTMRIYTPADWRYRWRKFFSEKLGFDWIPASPDDTGPSSEITTPRDPKIITSSNQVRKWLKEMGWTQQRLADEIAAVTQKGCSLRRVQRHLSGKSRTSAFYAEVDQVRINHQNTTVQVTKGG